MPTAPLFSAAKRDAHYSKDRLSQEHISILVTTEPPVKSMTGYSAVFRVLCVGVSRMFHVKPYGETAESPE